MLNCDICNTDKHYRIKSIGNGIFACLQCFSKRGFTKETGVGLTSKVKVGSIWATKRQLDELNRREFLPYSTPDGGYSIGRRMENGKVSDTRQPDYRS